MSDETTTEDQEKHLLKRWRKYEAMKTLPFLLLCLGLIIIAAIQWNGKGMAFTVTIAVLTAGIGSAVTFRSVRRKFIQGMTPQEKRILERWNETSLDDYEKRFLMELATEYHKINPPTEYLRASQQTQDDTLLRAATHTDKTPQEQLLRPSQNEEA